MDKTFNICSYNIVSITPHDEQIVIQFLKNFFFRHEPLVLSLDIIKEVKSLEKLQNYAFKTLDNGELIYYNVSYMYKIIFTSSVLAIGLRDCFGTFDYNLIITKTNV